jgi:hypothetical protein
MFYLTSLMDKGNTLFCIWEGQEEKVVLRYFYYPKDQPDQTFEQGQVSDPLVYRMYMQSRYGESITPTAQVDDLTPFVLEMSNDFEQLKGDLALRIL